MNDGGQEPISELEHSLTAFQTTCSARVRALLAEAGLPWVSQTVAGASETYLVLRVRNLSNRKLEIYIYADEAGFFVGDKWIISESQDFSTPFDLLDAFIKTLRTQVEGIEVVQTVAVDPATGRPISEPE